MTDSSQCECKDTDCEAKDADTSDGVFDKVWPPSSNESGGLTVIGIIVGGAFEDATGKKARSGVHGEKEVVKVSGLVVRSTWWVKEMMGSLERPDFTGEFPSFKISVTGVL